MSRGLGRGVGFSKLISVGNESDLSVGEFAGLLVDDPHTRTILLFMETLRDADKLAHAARRAYAAGKQVIVYKLGRSEVGQDLAASHTGAMAGSDEMADAFFRAHSIVRVDTLENLFELPALLRGHKPSKRHRVAVMTTTGGGAASVVDRLGTLGVEVVGPTRRGGAKLAAKNIRISKARLTDLTLAGAKKGDLQRGARTPARVRSLRSRARGRRQLGPVPAAGRDRAADRSRYATGSRSRRSRRRTPRLRSSCWRTRASRASARPSRAPTRSARGATGSRPIEQPRPRSERVDAAARLLAKAGRAARRIPVVRSVRGARRAARRDRDHHDARQKARRAFPVVAKIFRPTSCTRPTPAGSCSTSPTPMP